MSLHVYTGTSERPRHGCMQGVVFVQVLVDPDNSDG